MYLLLKIDDCEGAKFDNQKCFLFCGTPCTLYIPIELLKVKTNLNFITQYPCLLALNSGEWSWLQYPFIFVIKLVIWSLSHLLQL